MAGWSMLRNGSLDCIDVINENKDSICRPDVNSSVKDHKALDESNDDNEAILSCLFDQVLSVLADEAASRGCYRPIPAMLGDGKSLDLLELFRVVKKRGGFDLVNGFWSFVVKELGLDVQASASIKLVYFQYLYELERWLRKRSSSNGKSGNRQGRPGGNLEAEFKRLLLYGFRMGKDKKNKKKKIHMVTDVVKSKLSPVDTIDVDRKCNGIGSKHTDDDEKFHDYNDKCKGKALDIHVHPPCIRALGDENRCLEKCSNNNAINDDDVVILDTIIGKKLFSSRKRKRESVSRMLNWVNQIAKCPDHPSIGEIPSLSELKDHKGDELWALAIGARDALLKKRQVHISSKQSLLQNNHKMHPSMYEDVIPLNEPSAEMLRSSERLPALIKSRTCSCCNSSRSAPKTQLTSPPKTRINDAFKESTVLADDLSAVTTTLGPLSDEHVHRHVFVGRRFQAEVPEWTGSVCESDSKWLGTKVWPLEYGEHNVHIEADSIGKGRPDICDCDLPGSVECVRFHIAENRVKLKIELGSMFYHWKFDRMGEEISLRWTVEEEKRFKDVVRCNLPSLDRSFWDNSRKYFHRKTKEDLVSYYFNVFLVQRRSYQNRVTPKHIDSDDDESEFGSLSDTYGHRALKVVHGTNMLTCVENKQCSDFE
ncbi:AT-rich interactive domain-containing protein 2-like [Mercurialis annua]|uniref:AT-rich interactive domain-containing protein 2-like n=1 Tax=Mercurialis annua TaxID=3986 RepID=UPI00215E9EE1|nr:AT-rich interactive domain-containing protein 2-like [Mercurialis annua]